MMGRRADRLFAVRIEDHYVGVGADGDCPFLRKQAEYLRGCGRGQLDKTIQTYATLRHAVVIDQAHSVLDAGASVRNFAEIAAAQFLLLLEAERAVVGRNHLQVVAPQSAPEQ